MLYIVVGHVNCKIIFNSKIQPFKDEAQTALFKDPVRNAL
jgi:hypothetical protein